MIKNKLSDILGISSSSLCLIHCALPSIISIISTGLGSSEAAHSELEWHDILFSLISLSAVYFASKNTNSSLLKSGFWISIIGFNISLIGAKVFDIDFLMMVSYAFSISLISLHLINIKGVMIRRRPQPLI